MLPDRVSNPGPLTYESGALPIALRGPAVRREAEFMVFILLFFQFGINNLFIFQVSGDR